MVEFTISCPNDCMGRGECNYLTALCICDPGFGGPDCSLVEITDEMDENESILNVMIHVYCSIWDSIQRMLM